MSGEHLQRYFFDVSPSDLTPLAAGEAVFVLREMLWGEALRLGIPVTSVDVPFAITDPDGGIDANVADIPHDARSAVIRPPRTSYQVKTGGFALRTPGEAESLLMLPAAIDEKRKAGRTKAFRYTPNHLNTRVRACLDAGGTFVTALFGNDGAEREDDASVKLVLDFLIQIDPKYAAAAIQVWRQSKICGLLKGFPAVTARVRRNVNFPLVRHEDWIRQDAEMAREFVAAADQQTVIEGIQTALRDRTGGSPHLRVCGEPGIGKTRLILEATRAPDLQAAVLYAAHPSQLEDALPQLEAIADHCELVLIVDECDPEQRGLLRLRFKNRGPNIRVISIYMDESEGDRTRDYRFFQPPPLPDDKIVTIFKQYGVPESDLQPWARECEGSPRVAHVVGMNLHDHPGEPLREDGLVRVWHRFLAAGEDPNGQVYKTRHLVVASLALFKRFGYGGNRTKQAGEVYDKIISKLDHTISRAAFDDVISTLRARKVLQGEYVLYITPRLFHARVWMDWWNKYAGLIGDVSALVKVLSPELREWFGEMFQYAQDAPAAKNLAAKLFGPEGPFRDVEWLKTDEGGKFFFHLTQADPRRGLEFLNTTIGTETREQLLEFKGGRRSVIWALEGLAIFPELFPDAAQLMLQLAEAENESWSNNATGTFSNLFTLGYGDVAPTALAPGHRLPVLLKAISTNKRRARIALKAFDRALETHFITRLSGHEWYAARNLKRWSPKTYGEIFDAYRLYWHTLLEQLPILPESVGIEAARILLTRARGLCSIKALALEIVDDLSTIADQPYVDARAVLEAIESILHYDRKDLDTSVRQRLESLRDRLIGSGFSSRLRRYVGMDLLEDKFDDDGEQTDKIGPQLNVLAEEAISDPNLLNPELSWLVTDEAKNGYRFGGALAELDTPLALWPAIVKAWLDQKNASEFFIGGYLSAVFEKNPLGWEILIVALTEHPKMVAQLPNIIWRSGMTERVARLLLGLAKAKAIDPSSLRIFSYGRASERIPDNVLTEWLDVLLDDGSFKSATAALDLCGMSTIDKADRFEPETLRKVLFNPALFSNRTGAHRETMAEHHWVRLAMRLLTQQPDTALSLARLILENLGNDHAVIEGYWGEARKVLDSILTAHSVDVWKITVELLGPPIDGRAFYVTRWLRGSDDSLDRRPGALAKIPREEVWRWVGDDPEKRASYLSTFAPKEFSPTKWHTSLMRELLCQFGHKREVRSAVSNNFLTGGWSGPASQHYEAEKKQLLTLRSGENNPNVLRWLDENIDALGHMIEESKVEEEARGY